MRSSKERIKPLSIHKRRSSEITAPLESPLKSLKQTIASNLRSPQPEMTNSARQTNQPSQRRSSVAQPVFKNSQVTFKSRNTHSVKSDSSYTIETEKSGIDIFEEPLPHLPEIAHELIEIYKPQEMDAHRARHAALKMLDTVESQLNESGDFDGTFKDINRSEDSPDQINAKTHESQSPKSNKANPGTAMQAQELSNSPSQKSMKTVDEEAKSFIDSQTISETVSSMVQKGHSRQHSKTTQQLREKAIKQKTLIRKQTIAVRPSMFAREVGNTEPDQPPAEGIIYNEKAKIQNKIIGGGLVLEKTSSHKVNNAFQLRVTRNSKPSSQHGSQRSLRKTSSLHSSYAELYHLAHVITKPPDQRSPQDYELMHEYFMRENKFLHNIRYQDKNGANGLETVHKIYRMMSMKMYENPMSLCKYGEMGDQFFIVLKGTVGIMVPNMVNESYNTYFELFQRIVQEFNYIHSYKDQHSRVIKQFIDIFSYQVIKKLSFRKSTELQSFIEEILTQEQEIYEKYGIRFQERIINNARFLTDFNRYLKNQQRKQERDDKKGAEKKADANIPIRRSTKKYSGGQGITSHYIKQEGNMKVKMQVLQEVAQYGSGYSFGELSLINNKPRAATVYVKSSRVITAVLNKRDYLKCLGDAYKQTIDEKIEKIQQFMYFKPFTRIKLRQLIYFFQERVNDTAYVRDQYIYRQGDPVDGVYCILKGEVKRIKENWTMARGKEENDISNPSGAPSSYMNMSNYSYDANDQSRSQNLGIINEFRRRNAQQIVLSYINNPEIIGVEEIVLKKNRRMQSMKVNTEKCEVFFIDVKDFKDKFFNSNPAFKHILCEKLELQQVFHDELEKKATEFQAKNQDDSLNIIDNQRSPLQKNSSSFQRKMDLLGQGTNMLVDNLGQPLDINYKSASSKIRQIAKAAAKRNMQKKVVEQKTQPLQKYDPIRAAELLQEQFPSKLRNLEAAIDKEIQKNEPDITKLIQQLRQRRNEIAKEQASHVDQNAVIKYAHLASISTTGKISEVNMVKKFASAQGGYKDNHIDGSKLSIETLTKNLIENAESYYAMWKSERMHDEYLDKIAQNLTVDTREQKSLKEFKEKLPEFEKYLMQQPQELLQKLHVPRYEKVDFEQLVKNSSPRRSRSVKKAALETFQNQRPQISPNSVRKEDSPERFKSSQRSKSPGRGLDTSRRGGRTPRKEGVNLISYFFEWMSRNNTVAMHPFHRDGNSFRGQITQQQDRRQLSVSRFEQSKQEISTMQNGFEVKRRSRSSLGGLKQPLQTVNRKIPNTYQAPLPQDDTEAVLDLQSARAENLTSIMNESYASKQQKSAKDLQTSQLNWQGTNTEEDVQTPTGAFASNNQQEENMFKIDDAIPASPSFKQQDALSSEKTTQEQKEEKTTRNVDIKTPGGMYQFKIRKTKRTTGERNEEANQNEESPLQIQKEFTEITDVLNDQAQVQIKVTKEVKIDSKNSNSEIQGSILSSRLNQHALPNNILSEHNENYQKREEEINKLKQSIMGVHGMLNEDGAPHTGSREHEELDQNLTSNLRQSISPRYTHIPSKEFSPQNHLDPQYLHSNLYQGTGITSEVNLFDAQNKFFQRQQLLSNAHRFRIDSAVAKQLKTEASHETIPEKTKLKSKYQSQEKLVSHSRFDDDNTNDTEGFKTGRTFKRQKKSVGSTFPNNWVSPLQWRKDTQSLKKSASLSNGLEGIGKSTSGASGFNVGFKNLPKQQKKTQTFNGRNATYNSNQVQGFIPTTRVIVSRPASTGEGLFMRRNFSQQNFGESLQPDNLQPRNHLSRAQSSGTMMGQGRAQHIFQTVDSLQIQSAPHQNLVTAVPKSSVLVQNQQIKQKKAQAQRNKQFKKAEGYEKFTDRVLQKLQIGAKVQGTFSSEQKPPILGTGLSRTSQNYNKLRTQDPPLSKIPIDKNPVLIDKNNHVRVTFGHMRRSVEQL